MLSWIKRRVRRYEQHQFADAPIDRKILIQLAKEDYIHRSGCGLLSLP